MKNKSASAMFLRYKTLFTDKSFLISFFLGLIILTVAIVVNYFASLYATESASNSVTDIVLSNIPVFNVDAAFVYGPITFWVIMAIVCLMNPKRFPFLLKSIALFVIIRSVFITLTHIGPFPDHTMVGSLISPSVLRSVGSANNFFIFSGGGDLFFSGHTGLPFLMTLAFWHEKLWRYFCLISSFFFAVVVLLGHLHYSIDVLSAFFITYTIYRIAEIWFKKDRQMFLQASDSRSSLETIGT